MATTQSNAQDKSADTAKANVDRTIDQGARFANAAQDGLGKMDDLREQATENTRQIVQTGIEAASRQAREVGERLTRGFGIGGEDSQRLAEQSKQNLEAVARCGTVLTHAFQDVSRSWMELSQKQWQRNFDGLNRLTRARTAHEFAAIQSELVRENLQNVVHDSRTIAERSLRAADEASKTFANAASR